VVNGADYADCNGEYELSTERVDWAPQRFVYRHVAKDRWGHLHIFSVRKYAPFYHILGTYTRGLHFIFIDRYLQKKFSLFAYF
jgi:hypothetical protein